MKPILTIIPLLVSLTSFVTGFSSIGSSALLVTRTSMKKRQTINARLVSHDHDGGAQIASRRTTLPAKRQNSLVMKATNDDSSSQDTKYDVIVVGSGNGACALLSECLKYAPDDYKILVLEQGQNFYFTSDVTHENGWSKTYSSGSIFKLHNAMTPRGRNIISGRAVTMGGGGSINYTMMHESSAWLSKYLGQDECYWDKMKIELGAKFKRESPFEKRIEDFTKIIEERATDCKIDDNPYKSPNEADNFACHIPSLNDKWEEYPSVEAKQLYLFPTQFNKFGQRTNSGVSLVDWRDERIEIKCLREVKDLDIVEGTCKSLSVVNTETNEKEQYSVNSEGKVILCGGSASPRLLMRSNELSNKNIGKFVKDHICMPLGLYIVSEKRDDKIGQLIGPTNNYESIFGTLTVKNGNGDDRELVTLDFFSGELNRLIYLVSSLYLAYLPFNRLKRLLSRFPYLFTILSNTIRVLLSVLVFVVEILIGFKDFITFQGWGATQIKITTSLAKFSTYTNGQYEEDDDKIVLGFFEDDEDFTVAEEGIKENIAFLESLGDQPPFLIRLLFQFITKIPYEEDQVKRYVKNFSRNTLLSEQHLAGGCLFGKVVDTGEEDPSKAGKVFDTTNLHVADLSTVPIPRVSTQMTAYLVGHYVGKQLFGPTKKTE